MKVRHIAKPVPSISPYYVARKNECEIMNRHLVVFPGDKRKIFVITGMGGCGKTQMVAYFVERHQNKSVVSMNRIEKLMIDDRYRHIFFIDGSSTASICRDLESAIRSINGHEQDTYEGALAFMSRASESGGWLYILDNADDSDLDFTLYLPSCSHGTIIITSRNRRVGMLSTTHHLELGEMQQQEAVETLCRAARKANPLVDAELAQAIHLVETLGYLALAIVQAGIYIHEMTSGSDGGFGFGQYYLLHKHHRDQLLRKQSHVSLDRYPRGVYETLDISYTRLPESCREFLHLCSFLRHTNVPVSMFSSAATANFEDSWELVPRAPDFQSVQTRLRRLFSQDGRWDELLFRKLAQTLFSFSLLSSSWAHDLLLLRLHPLVHSYARDKLGTDELPMYRQMAITCISSSYIDLPRNARQFVLPHFVGIYQEGEGDSIHTNDMIRLGGLMDSQRSYWEAEKVFRRVAEVLMETQGRDGEDTNFVLGQLASTLRGQGKWNEAEALQRETLAMSQRILGLEHPDTISASADLALTLWNQGKWKEAEVLQREVLATRQKILGLEHLETISTSANLASTLWNQGEWNKAEVLEREVLATRQKILGPEHVDTITASADLASTFCDQGKWNEAKILQKEVLATRRRILGLDHPHTIDASAKLASTIYYQGKFDDAEVLQREVLAKLQRILGLEHPSTITSSANLANTFRDQGKLDKAEVLGREVLSMRQNILGLEHPDSIDALHNLACTLHAKVQTEEALPLSLQANQLAEKVLGLNHPRIIKYLELLVKCYESTSKHEEASSVRAKLELIHSSK
jgi:tetratricopeptide (TPR) repeat protein